jgi:hypothetical protein
MSGFAKEVRSISSSPAAPTVTDGIEDPNEVSVLLEEGATSQLLLEVEADETDSSSAIVMVTPAEKSLGSKIKSPKSTLPARSSSRVSSKIVF